MRIGENGEITRFLIELSEKTSIDTHVDAQNQSVKIRFLKPIDWSILSTKKRRIFGLVKNYSFGPSKNKAHQFLIQSNSAIDIEKIFWLKNTANDGYRLVIDLKKTIPNPKTTIIQKKAPKQIDPVIAKETAPIPKVAIQVKNDLAEIEDLLAILKPHQENTSTISVDSKIHLPPYDIRPMPKPLLTKDKKSFMPVQKTIVIDPGHGGQDPGTISCTGVYEKNIALQMGFLVKNILEKSPYYKVYLTRVDDRYLRLRERLEIAKRVKADLVISLHADSSPKLDNRGASLYLLSNEASDAEAEALAKKENKEDIISGVDLSENNREINNILIDLAQRDSLNLAFDFAQHLKTELVPFVPLILKPIRFADLAVLKAPDIPSILIELGCISNKEDDRLLKTAQHRLKIAQAIRRALDRFFEFGK
ncbi:MAG: N-acetylmuramoyl-L-alanine amidase [Alphaproteobacteria bacterium]|nr:N-acetylmuramoyl-L-alanine amidase [Alphaproteobacteria bacterium]